MNSNFLSLFKDPLFVSIPYSGGFVTHSHDIENIRSRNTVEKKEGAYFTVNGFANFKEGETTGRTKANVTTFNCNFLDIDLTPETRRTEAELIYKELCLGGLRPTAVVLTGKGLHVYWIYKAPFGYSAAKLKEYEVLQNAIVDRYLSKGADKQARDAARVLRLPGMKYFNKAGENTCDTELLYINEDSKYTPVEVANYFRQTIKIDTKAGETLLRLNGDDFDFSSILNVKKGNRHHASYSAALSLIQRSKDLPSARKMFQGVLSTWESPSDDPLDWDDSWNQFEEAKKFIEKDRPQAFMGDPEGNSISITIASNVKMQKIEWLWEGFIAKGKAHMLTGEPGLGKSQITIDIASRLSMGERFPSYILGAISHEPIGVLILSAEDSPEDTMKPRLIAAGADLDKVAFLSSAMIEKDKNGKLKIRSLALKEDAEQILKAIATLPFKVGLIIIDPVSAYLSSSQDSNSNSDARGTLAQLQHTVMDKGIALLMINHTNKNTQAKSAHMRSMGSVGWNAAARATFYVFKDQDNGKRVFSVGKMNLAKEAGRGFFYEIKEKDVEIDGDKVGVPYIEWNMKEFPTREADDYVQANTKTEKKSSECEEELELYMVGKSEVPTSEGMAFMKERGFSRAEVYRAARKQGIIGEYGVWKNNK